MQTLVQTGAARAARPTTIPRGLALRRAFSEVNKELWVVLSLVSLALLLNYLVASQRVVLGIYALPTLCSAYLYGRRHAVTTAIASVLTVAVLFQANPQVLGGSGNAPDSPIEWMDLAAWGGILIGMAITTGTLYEKKEAQVRELRATYHGVLLILRQFISNDQYTQNHCYRVSVYATRIAASLGLSNDAIEDVRAAALLHDIGKLEISREVLYKAARLTQEEFDVVRTHVERGMNMMEPVGGSLRRVLPIVLAHHERFDGTGYNTTVGEDIPLEARIIAVADVFDALTSDRPYRKAMSTFEARDVIRTGSGKDFDPAVVDGFLNAFRRGEMEVPDLVL